MVVFDFAIVIVVMLFFFIFFNDTATTEIYTLSLHDALPISTPAARCVCRRSRSLARIRTSSGATRRRPGAPTPFSPRRRRRCFPKRRPNFARAGSASHRTSQTARRNQAEEHHEPLRLAARYLQQRAW